MGRIHLKVAEKIRTVDKNILFATKRKYGGCYNELEKMVSLNTKYFPRRVCRVIQGLGKCLPYMILKNKKVTIKGIGTFYLKHVPKGTFCLGRTKIRDYDETVNVVFKLSKALRADVKHIWKSKFFDNPDNIKIVEKKYRIQ